MATEEQLSNNSDQQLNDSAVVALGQRLTISDRYVTSLSFLLRKIGTPAEGAGLNFSIRKVSNNALIVGEAAGAVSSLPTSNTWITITFDSPTYINEEVRFYVETSSIAPDNCAVVRYQNTDVKASEKLTYTPTMWTDNDNWDCAYKYTYSVATLGAVTTQAVTDIAQTTATGNGNITSLGYPNPTQHGHCWSTSANPTIADSKTQNGTASATGAFTSAITGLLPLTLYHTRAYATNVAGTSYGEDVEFTTLGIGFSQSFILG